MNYKVEILQKEDVEEALALVQSVFDEFVGQDYSEIGRTFFKRAVDVDFINGLPSRNGFSLTIKDEGKIIGIISIRDFSHVALFFVKKEYQGKGIGRKLFEGAKRRITKLDKIKEIQVNSSPYAVPIYLALGFKIAEAEKEENGMKYVPMILNGI